MMECLAPDAELGPRFLHSTGQLHKGGPGSRLFLQLTAEHAQDVAIPDARYTFGVLADAQAVGDLQALRASVTPGCAGPPWVRRASRDTPAGRRDGIEDM